MHGRPTRKQLIDFLRNRLSEANAGLSGGTAGRAKLARLSPLTELRDLQLFRSNANLSATHREELAVLSIDVRDSSTLAERHTPEDVLRVFQCFLPLTAHLVTACHGEVVGWRGDGILAVFGLGVPSPKRCVVQAVQVGVLMIQATKDILNPFLRENGILIELSVGVAIDFGAVTIAKIGRNQLDSEVTAYGAAVNLVAKNSTGINKVWLSYSSGRLYGRLGGRNYSPITFKYA